MFPFPNMMGADTGPFVRWDPLIVPSDITYSVDRGLATWAAASGVAGPAARSARSTLSNVYFELVFGAGGPLQCGISDDIYASGSADLQGSDRAIGWDSTGPCIVNGVTIGTAASYIPGDVLGIAFDAAGGATGAGALSFWARVNGGNWNNNGAADPATGVGGFAYTLVGGATKYFAAAWLSGAGRSCTIRALPREFSGAVPASFTALGLL